VHVGAEETASPGRSLAGHLSADAVGARAIRQHGDLSGARTLGRVTGEVLRMLGLDINFAPVMSIITQARSQLTNGLYSRSLGSSPGEVLGYTTVYMRGLQATAASVV